MTHAEVSLSRPRFGQTMRRDRWWALPAVVFLGFSAFIVLPDVGSLLGRALDGRLLPVALPD